MALHLDGRMTGALLDDIEHDYSTASACKIAAMEEWLKRDSAASWYKVVSALRTVSMDTLALQIESKYCKPSTEPLTAPKLSESGNVRPAVNSPPPELAPVDTDNSVDGNETDGAKFQATTEEATQLQEQFVTVLTHTKKCFKKKEAKSKSQRFLKNFKVTLTSLPLSKKKHQRHLFLKKENDRITKTMDTDEIFCVLEPYWNYIDYAFLGYLIKEFGTEELQQEMEQYIRELEQFEKKTSVQDFDLAVEDNRVLPAHFKTVTRPPFKDPAECSLHEVRQFKNEVVNKSNLSEFTLYVKCSSGAIVFAYPPDAHTELWKVLDEQSVRMPAKVHRDRFKENHAYSMPSGPANEQGEKKEAMGRRSTAPTIRVQKVGTAVQGRTLKGGARRYRSPGDGVDQQKREMKNIGGDNKKRVKKRVIAQNPSTTLPSQPPQQSLQSPQHPSSKPSPQTPKQPPQQPPQQPSSERSSQPPQQLAPQTFEKLPQQSNPSPQPPQQLPPQTLEKLPQQSNPSPQPSQQLPSQTPEKLPQQSNPSPQPPQQLPSQTPEKLPQQSNPSPQPPQQLPPQTPEKLPQQSKPSPQPSQQLPSPPEKLPQQSNPSPQPPQQLTPQTPEKLPQQSKPSPQPSQQLPSQTLETLPQQSKPSPQPSQQLPSQTLEKLPQQFKPSPQPPQQLPSQTPDQPSQQPASKPSPQLLQQPSLQIPEQSPRQPSLKSSPQPSQQFPPQKSSPQPPPSDPQATSPAAT